MTNQSAFDSVWSWFIIDGHPQARRTDEVVHREDYVGCMYRTKDGNKCALGCLLPDELYSPEMECEGASNVVHWNADTGAYFSGVDNDLLRDMQKAHDNGHSTFGDFTEYMTFRLRGIADNYSLKVPE